MLKIASVSYLNSLPFIFGLKKSESVNKFDLIIDIPSKCAEYLKSDIVDIALVPVALLASLEKYNIVSNYCIGADGPVKTVLLLSQKPLADMKKIYLDSHSMTSVKLVKILAEKYWNITPEWEDTKKGSSGHEYIDKSSIVLIGDKTFEFATKYKYVYDLAEEWKKFTGLPFVFAVWISKKPIPIEVSNTLNKAFESGLNMISIIAREYAMKTGLSEIEIVSYLTKNIKYKLTNKMKKSMEMFISMLK